LVNLVHTSLINVYDTADTYTVTAGVGSFNTSLLQAFFNNIQSLEPSYQNAVVPYTIFAAVYALVINPLLSTVSQPVHCAGPNCMSYLLSGGLMMVAPWTSKEYTGYPLVRIKKVPSVQLDFAWPLGNDIFDDSDCDIFGEYGTPIGIRVCVAQDTATEGSLRAGTTHPPGRKNHA
jgi:hypothetical protein